MKFIVIISFVFSFYFYQLTSLSHKIALVSILLHSVFFLSLTIICLLLFCLFGWYALLPILKRNSVLQSIAMASVTSSVTASPPDDFDEQESRYLARSRILHRVRLGIAGTIFATAIATFACEATTMHHYNDTEWYNLVWLPLWPLNLDTRGTSGLIAGGVLISMQSLIYIIMALLPSVRRLVRPILMNGYLLAFNSPILAHTNSIW